MQTDISLIEDVLRTTEIDSQLAADVKVSNRFRHCFSTFEDVFAKQGTPILAFEADKEITKLLRVRKSFGNISAEACGLNISRISTEKEKSRKSQEGIITSFLNTAFRIHCHLSVYESGKRKEHNDISGCEIMPKGEIVLCDYANKRLILLNSVMSLQTRLVLTNDPYDVSAANDTTAIVTLPLVKQLQFVDVRPKSRLANKVQLDKKCWGIHVENTNIYVTCFNTFLFGRRDGEVRILDMNGNFLKQIGILKSVWIVHILPSPISLSVIWKGLCDG